MLHGINHIALPIRNLEVSDRFYRGILGLFILAILIAILWSWGGCPQIRMGMLAKPLWT